MPRPGSLRASDADRDQVVERLNRAATEGRLTADELGQRVRHALTAVTYADLEATIDDLPRPRSAARSPRGEPRRSAARWAVATTRANPYLLVFIIPMVIAAGAMLFALSVTWLTLMAVVMILTGDRHHHHHHWSRRGPWTLIDGARRDWI